MTYGFRPENWPAFQAELLERAITVADIEKIEFRPRIPHVARITLPHRAEIAQGMLEITVTLRSGAGRVVEPEPNPIGTEFLARRGRQADAVRARR